MKNIEKKVKKKNNCVPIIFAIILIICFWSYIFFKNYKEEEKIYVEEGEKFGFFENTKSNNIEQAKKNTYYYIKNKYGFKPKIIDVDLDMEHESMSYKTGYAYVKAKYEEKEFNVVIPSDRKSIKGADDYQKKEISEAIVNNIISEIGKVPYTYIINSYSSINKKLGNEYINRDVNCIRDYYNGTNILEIIENNEFYVWLSYLEDLDLKKLENVGDDSIFNSNIDIAIGKFREKERNSTLLVENYRVYSESELKELAMYLEEAFLRIASKKNDMYNVNNKYYKFDVLEYEGMYFYAENLENLKIEKVSGIDWTKYINIEKYCKLKDDYIFSGVEGKIYIFIPVERVEDTYSYLDLETYLEVKLFLLNENENFDYDYSIKKGKYYYFDLDVTSGNNRMSIFKRIYD